MVLRSGEGALLHDKIVFKYHMWHNYCIHSRASAEFLSCSYPQHVRN